MQINPRTLVAEMVGTFLLTFAIICSVSGPLSEQIATPVVAAITLALVVFIFGVTSGAHINPAVTIGLALARKVELPTAFTYICVQFIGAGLAMFVARLILPEMPADDMVSSLKAFTGEAIGTSILMLSVCAVVWEKTSKAHAGIVIGTGLLIGIIVASVVSGGVLNPAVAFGLGVFKPAYFLGPISGGIIGVVLAKYVYK